MMIEPIQGSQSTTKNAHNEIPHMLQPLFTLQSHQLLQSQIKKPQRKGKIKFIGH